MKKTIIALLALTGVAAAATEVNYTLTKDATATWGDPETETLGTGITFNETDDILTLKYLYTTYSGTGSSSKDSWITPTNAAYKDSYSPSAQLSVGSSDVVTLSFRITNSSKQAITLNALSFDVYCMTGTGGDKAAHEAYDVYASINGGTPSVLSAGRGGTVSTANFDTDIDLAAGECVDVSYSMKFKAEYSAYYGLTGGSVTYTVPEPTTATLSLLALAGLAARRRR